MGWLKTLRRTFSVSTLKLNKYEGCIPICAGSVLSHKQILSTASGIQRPALKKKKRPLFLCCSVELAGYFMSVCTCACTCLITQACLWAVWSVNHWSLPPASSCLCLGPSPVTTVSHWCQSLFSYSVSNTHWCQKSPNGIPHYQLIVFWFDKNHKDLETLLTDTAFWSNAVLALLMWCRIREDVFLICLCFMSIFIFLFFSFLCFSITA